MTALTRDPVEMLSREVLRALQSGQLALAGTKLDELIGLETGDEIPWLEIAEAARASHDHESIEKACGRQLARNRHDFVALLLMGASRARCGDDRAALAYYRAALAAANRPDVVPPSQLVPLLHGAERFIAQASRRFSNCIEQAVSSLDIGNGPADARLRHSLDLLFGRSELYLQQPSMFYFAGLAQRAFFEREDFAWVADLEAAAPAIRAELLQMLTDPAAAVPYVESTPDRPSPANPLLNDPSWSAVHLLRDGKPVLPNAAVCPATIAALERVPMPVIANRSPMALFSVLEAQTHIQPHHGLLNTRLICHLPLIVPTDCRLRVGAETREWQEDRCLIFDDSIEHEAWNRSDRTRVVLLFEIWRPDLTLAERTALAAIFEAIDTVGPEPQETHDVR